MSDHDSDCEIIENMVTIVCVLDNSDEELPGNENGTPNVKGKNNSHEQQLATENVQKSSFQPMIPTTSTQATNYENVFKPILAADKMSKAELQVMNKPRLGNNYTPNRTAAFTPRLQTENSRSAQSLRNSQQQSAVNMDEVFKVRYADNGLNSKPLLQQPRQINNKTIPQLISVKEPIKTETSNQNQQNNIEDVFKPKFDTSTPFNPFRRSVNSPKKLHQQQVSQLQNVDNGFQPRLAKNNEHSNTTLTKVVSSFNNQNAKTVDFQNIFKPRLANETKKLIKNETITHEVAEDNIISDHGYINDVFKPRMQADRKSMPQSPQVQVENKGNTSIHFQDVFNVRFASTANINQQAASTSKLSTPRSNAINISSCPEHKSSPRLNNNLQNKPNNRIQISDIVDLCGSSPDSSNEMESIFKPIFMDKSSNSNRDKRAASNVIEVCSSPEEEISKPSCSKRDYYANEKMKTDSLQSFKDAFKPKLEHANTTPTVDLSSSPEPELLPKSSSTAKALQKQNSEEIDVKNTFQVRLACNNDEPKPQNSTTLSKSIHADANTEMKNVTDNTFAVKKSPKTTTIDYENAFQVRLANNVSMAQGHANVPFKETSNLNSSVEKNVLINVEDSDAIKQCSTNKNIKNDFKLEQGDKTAPQKEHSYVDVFKPRLADNANLNNSSISLKSSPPQKQISPQSNSVDDSFKQNSCIKAELPCKVPNPFHIFNRKPATDYKDVFKPRMAVVEGDLKDSNLMKVSSSLSLCKRKQKVIDYDDVFKPRLAIAADKSKETDVALTAGAGLDIKSAESAVSIDQNQQNLNIKSDKDPSMADKRDNENTENPPKVQAAVNENNACSESLVSSTSDTKLAIAKADESTVNEWCKETARENTEMSNNFGMSMNWETEDSADSHCLTIDERMCENIETDEEIVNIDKAAVVIDDKMGEDSDEVVNEDKLKNEQMEVDELDDDLDVGVESNNDDEQTTDKKFVRVQTTICKVEDDDEDEILIIDDNSSKGTDESSLFIIETNSDGEKPSNKLIVIQNDSAGSQSIVIDEDEYEEEDDIKIIEDNDNLDKISLKSIDNNNIVETNKTEDNKTEDTEETEDPEMKTVFDDENVSQVPFASSSTKHNASQSNLNKELNETCGSTTNVHAADAKSSIEMKCETENPASQNDIKEQHTAPISEKTSKKEIDENGNPISPNKQITGEQKTQENPDKESKKPSTLIVQVHPTSNVNYENVLNVPLATIKADNAEETSAIITENKIDEAKTADDDIVIEQKDSTVVIEDLSTQKENASPEGNNPNNATSGNLTNDDFENIFYIPMNETNNNFCRASLKDHSDINLNNIHKQEQNIVDEDKVSNSDAEIKENKAYTQTAFDEIMQPRLGMRNGGSDTERSADLQPDVFVIESDIEEGEVQDDEDLNDSSLQIINENNGDEEALQVDTIDDAQVEIERVPIFEIIFPQKQHFDKLSAKIVQSLTESLNAVTPDNEAYELIEYSADLSIQAFQLQTKVVPMESAVLPMTEPVSMTLETDSEENEQEDDSLLFTIDTEPAEKIDAAKVPSYKKAIRDPLNDEATPSKRLKPDEDSCVRPRTQSCFNCGSNDHSIRDCTKRRNMKRIKMAKQKHLSKQERYHMDTEQRFSHLRPGIVSRKLKSALCLERGEIPPFFYRMRVFGYPPGWLEDAKVASSGLALFVDKNKELPGPNLDEGEVEEQIKFDINKIIDFPGFNTDPGDNFYDDFKFHCVPPMHHTHMKEQFIAMLGDNVYKGYKHKKLKALPASHAGAITIETTNQAINENMDIVEDDQLSDGTIETERPPPPIGSPPNDDIPPPPPPFCRNISESPPPPPPPFCRNIDESPPPPPPFIDDEQLPLRNMDSPVVSAITSAEMDIQSDDDNAQEVVVVIGDDEHSADNSKNNDTVEDDEGSPSLADLEVQQKLLLSELETAEKANHADPLKVTNNGTKNENESSKQDSNDDNETLNTTASNAEPAIESNTTETPATPATPLTPISSQRLVQESHVGTPLCKFSPYDKLPSGENFKVGVSDVINFENLPDSTGKYEKMKGVLKKVRNIVTELHKHEDD